MKFRIGVPYVTYIMDIDRNCIKKRAPSNFNGFFKIFRKFFFTEHL